MLCTNCKETEASVHLTQVVGSEVKKIHLCESCAAKSGLNLHIPVSLTDVLLGLGGQADKSVEEPDRSCPRCHLRRSDFKKSGRVGCPDCYGAFAEEMRPLLKSMHRSEQHVGKAPESQRRNLAMGAELERLRKELEKAVVAEDYEQAAHLRDLIRNCQEPTRPSGGGLS